MAKPRLPSDPQQTWAGGFLLDPARCVRSIEARSGLVVAGGSELYLLRPGEENLKQREPPLDIGPVHVAAAEPRGPRRYAFAAQEMLAIFLKRNGEDQILRIRPSASGPAATHLVWGGEKGPCSLYVRWDDGEVVRALPDMSDMDPLELPSMEAIAGDESGTVAMVSFDPEPRVFVTHDGVSLHHRALGAEPPEEEGVVHLAVAGDAVAVALGNGTVLLSRRTGEPFVPCDALAGAGPLAFEGTSSDAALFGAVCNRSEGAIVRVERSGAAMRTAEFDAEGGPALEITSMSWDASRHKLWAASPQVGILTSVAPVAKKGKKMVS